MSQWSSSKCSTMVHTPTLLSNRRSRLLHSKWIQIINITVTCSHRFEYKLVVFWMTYHKTQYLKLHETAFDTYLLLLNQTVWNDYYQKTGCPLSGCLTWLGNGWCPRIRGLSEYIWDSNNYSVTSNRNKLYIMDRNLARYWFCIY